MAGTNRQSCITANKDPYKLTLAKSQGSFSRTINSYPPTLGWNKIKEWLHYNFGYKQPAASMLIDQQQKTSEILQEYIQRFWTYYLNPVDYYHTRLNLWLILNISYETCIIRNTALCIR